MWVTESNTLLWFSHLCSDSLMSSFVESSIFTFHKKRHISLETWSKLQTYTKPSAWEAREQLGKMMNFGG